MKKTLYLLVVLAVLFISIVNSHWYKFQKIQEGNNIIYVRDLMGVPKHSNLYNQKYLIEIYNTNFNKYVFTYAIKDSILVSKWKEN